LLRRTASVRLRTRARDGRRRGVPVLEARVHRHAQRLPSQDLVRRQGVTPPPSEVLVVGGGIVGAATAYFLARKGVRVTLIEGEHPGWGASGRNPGFQWLHTRKAGIQMDLGKAGRRLADELKDELDDFELRPCGGMTYFFDERQAPLFRTFVDERRRAGLPMELLDGAEARRHCPALAESIVGATWNPLDAHQNTTRLVEALVAGARRNGATVVS